MKIVATNVDASRPTATPTARANKTRCLTNPLLPTGNHQLQLAIATIFQIGLNLTRNFAKLSSSKVQSQLELSLAQFSPRLLWQDRNWNNATQL